MRQFVSSLTGNSGEQPSTSRTRRTPKTRGRSGLVRVQRERSFERQSVHRLGERGEGHRSWHGSWIDSVAARKRWGSNALNWLRLLSFGWWRRAAATVKPVPEASD